MNPGINAVKMQGHRVALILVAGLVLPQARADTIYASYRYM